MSGERHSKKRMSGRNDKQRALRRQLQRVAVEGRPGACVGCGFEKGCADKGCAVLRKISQIAAESGAGTKKGENRQ